MTSRSSARFQDQMSNVGDSPEFPVAQRVAGLEIVESCFGVRNRNGRVVSPQFENVPPKDDTPANLNWHNKIQSPRSLRIIMERLLGGAYENAQDFYIDLKAVFSQISVIASRSSRDWQDAVKMDQHVDEKWSLQAASNTLPTIDAMFPEDLDEDNVTQPPTQLTHASPPAESISKPSTPPQTLKRARANSGSSTGSVAGPVNANFKRQKTSSGPTARSDEPRYPDKETGWMTFPEGSSSLAIDAALYGIISALREKKDPLGVPWVSKLPIPPNSKSNSTEAVTLDKIEARMRDQSYSVPEDFDRDLNKVFSVARGLCRGGTVSGGENPRLSTAAAVFTLQRLYQELTKGSAIATSRAVAMGSDTAPGSTVDTGNVNNTIEVQSTIQAVPPTTGLSKKDGQVLLSEVTFKDAKYRVGDFVHLMNAEDPAKPIIGQIFKLWRNVETSGRMVYVCWYYRPEQTVHPASRRFIENEVFRAYSFVDHPVEDILERCLVMFHTRYLRGRPGKPYWTPTMPTYICVDRYKDESKSFKKIKNWTSCIPVEVRDLDEDENFVFFKSPGNSATLKRVPSPFAKVAPAQGATPPDNFATAGVQGGVSVTTAGANPPIATRDHGLSERREEKGDDKGPMLRLPAGATTVAELAARQERFDPLPPSLVVKFRTRDAAGLKDDLLWFSAPPTVDMHYADTAPQHSVAYLAYLAQSCVERP